MSIDTLVPVLISVFAILGNIFVWIGRAHDTALLNTMRLEIQSMKADLSDKILTTVNGKYTKTELMNAVTDDIKTRIHSLNVLLLEVKSGLEHRIESHRDNHRQNN